MVCNAVHVMNRMNSHKTYINVNALQCLLLEQLDVVYTTCQFQVAGAPILILGNKIDKSTALSEEQLKWHLGVQHMCTGKGMFNQSTFLKHSPEFEETVSVVFAQR